MFKLAWRNLWRNRTRTFIVGTAIVFGYALMLISLGVSDDTYVKMLDAAAEGVGGEVLVHGDGWWESQSSDVVIDDAPEIEEKLRGIEGVDAVIPRVVINGLLTSPRGNEAVRLSGIDREREAKLDDPGEDLKSGEFLSDEFDDPIVIGDELAQRLRVERGDKLVLTATMPDGEVTRALFHLDGVIQTGGAGLGEAVAYTTVDSAQRAVDMSDQMTQFGLLTGPEVDHDTLAERVRDTVDTDRLEVLTWEEATPEMVGFIEMDQAFGYLYMIIVFIVVVLAIANTFMMAVMERVRELGLLNAIGMSPRRVGSLVLWETGLLAVISLAIGFLLALGGHFYLVEVGIDMAQLGGGDMELAGVNVGDMIMRSHINPVRWGLGTAIVFGAVMLSALYPAWRATRLAPSEAMRFYE